MSIINIPTTITLIAVLALFLGFNLYSLVFNETNHTSLDTYIFCYIYSLLFFLWLIFFRYLKTKNYKHNRLIFILLFTFCLLGIINVILFEKLNIMMFYELWIEKGMPGKYVF